MEMKLELRNGKIYIPSSTSPLLLQKNKNPCQYSHVNIKAKTRELRHGSQTKESTSRTRKWTWSQLPSSNTPKITLFLSDL